MNRRSRITMTGIAAMLACAVFAADAEASSAYTATISDPDGFTNIRADRSKKSKVVAKIREGEKFIVGKDERKSWWPVRKGGRFRGFIHKSRVQIADERPVGAFHVEKTERGWVRLWMSSAPFDAKKHRFTYLKDAPDFVETIDGVEPHGTDGNVPRQEISEFELHLYGKDIRVKRRLYRDCYEPNFYLDYIKLKVSKSGTVRVRMQASDGAGGYTVVWKFTRSGKQSRSFPEEA